MKFKKFGTKYVVRLDKGEEIVETLKKFCADNNIKLGNIQGLGAASKIRVGYFDVDKKEYFSKDFEGNFEIAPLIGNITTMDGEIYLHCHINFGDEKFGAHAGHLNSAIVSATFETTIDVIDGEVKREFNEEIGLNLYKF